jgi:carboxylesterase
MGPAPGAGDYHARVSALVPRLLRRRAVAPDDAPTTATVVPGAEPYAGGSGPDGVLLCHGFTGSPHSMRPWAEHLERDGFRVALPRLPGHGTTWQEMNATRWPDWYACVDRAFAELRETCDRVFLTGLSMGGTLALRLAEQHGDAVAGIALVNPSVGSADPRYRLLLPWLRYVRPSLAGISSDIALPGAVEGAYDRSPLHAAWSLTRLWAVTARDLNRVTQPLLVFKSDRDLVVDPLSLQLIRARVGSADLTVVPLERSYHVATLDYDAELIFTSSSAFFRRLAGKEAGRVPSG